MLKLKKKRYKKKNKPKKFFIESLLIYSSRNQYLLVNHNKRFYRGIWAYCYPRDKLIAFRNRENIFRRTEDIDFDFERVKVKMIKMSDKSISVDVPSDIKNRD